MGSQTEISTKDSYFCQDSVSEVNLVHLRLNSRFWTTSQSLQMCVPMLHTGKHHYSEFTDYSDAKL